MSQPGAGAADLSPEGAAARRPSGAADLSPEGAATAGEQRSGSVVLSGPTQLIARIEVDWP